MEKEFNYNDEIEDIVVTFNEIINEQFDMDLGLDLKRYLISLITEKKEEFIKRLKEELIGLPVTRRTLLIIDKLAGDDLK